MTTPETRIDEQRLSRAALADRAVCVLALSAMIAYARGPEHHRGDEIGTHGTKVIVVRPAQ